MPRKDPAPPAPEIVDRIKREVSAPGFLSDLIAWADRQCGKLLSLEDRIDPHKAIELVNAAVVDTCDGVRVWHPEARTLRRHLEQTVNSRIWHECERARRRRFVALVAANPDDSQDSAAALEVEVSERREGPRSRPDALVAQHEVRARVFGVLRGEAAHDPELLALLDAYEGGHHVESDAKARTGVAGQPFKNLVRRFKTIRQRIPDELRGAAIEIMSRDAGAPIASVARHRGRVIEVFADSNAANDSTDSVDALGGSGDGGDSTDGGGGLTDEAAA
jgi:hypothetical protein